MRYSRRWKLYGDGSFFDVKNDTLEQRVLADEGLAPKAAEAKRKLQAVLASMPKEGQSLLEFVPRRNFTLTVDNGKEFAHHESVAEALQIKVYFADPYSAWQRGLNENTNGLIRQYVPKGSDVRTLTDQQLQLIRDRLNDRPRKSLGFLTPNEIYYERKKLTG